MSICRTLILAAGLTALPVLAQAESMTDRANRAAAGGPNVLQIDPDLGRFRGPRAAVNGDPAIADAVPVPHVMNGGAFGYDGFDYYSSAKTVPRLGARPVPNEFIIAPAVRRPLP